MKCPNCKADNKEEAKFCRKCGGKFSVICPKCGAENLPGDNFCDQCGVALVETEKAPPIDYDRPQSYTPKYLAEKILTTRSSIEGERKFVTVLFADVAGSTAMFGNLDPEEVHRIMDGCFRILMDRIHRYEGTINQFTGDGIMALFGAPIAHENHSQRACYAALSIKRAIEDYGKKLRADYGLNFKMRFGMDSGLVMVGAVGNDLRMDYSADGNTTNLAKRLESIAAPGNILVSDNTYRQIKAYFKFESLGPVILKGIKEAQNAHLLIDSSSVKTRFEEAVSKGLVKFVGRKNSMATLKNTWNRAAEGFGQVLGIMGEPGVGKSRLLLEFKKLLVDDDIHFLESRCLPHGENIIYLPFLDILRSHFSIKEGQSDSDTTKNIKEKLTFIGNRSSPFMLSALQQLLSLGIDDESWHDIKAKQRRYHIFEALKLLFIKLSEEKPLIIVVDDLQWIDRASEEFLSFFVDSMSRNSIFLVLLYRPEYEHPWENRSYYSKLGLGQLSKKSSIELISALLEDVPVEVELEQLILTKSAGSPLFIEEFIYSLQENHFIKRKNNQFSLIRKVDSIKIPDTIQGLVAARIDNLDEALKGIIQTACVIGRDFEYRILQMVIGMGEELRSYLDKLQTLEYICEKELFPELEYTFRHVLIEEVAYSGLLLRRRTGLHAKIGLAAEYLHADKIEEFYEILAYHFSLGEDYPKAYKYLKLSGKKAEDNFSHIQAFQFFEKALKTYAKLPAESQDDAEKLDVCTLMTRPIVMLGFPKGSLKVLKKGAAIAKRLSDRKLLSRFHNDISILYTARGDSLSSVAHGEKSFAEAEKIEAIEIMAPLSLSLCYAYSTSCRYDKLIDISLRIADLIEKTKTEKDFFNTPFNLYPFVLGLCGMAMAMRGEFKDAKIVNKKALHQAVASGHKMTLAFNELQYANLLVLQGDGKTAIPHCENSIKYSEDIEWLTLLSQAWTVLGYSKYLLGELERALEFVSKGLKIQEDTGIKAMLPLHYWILSMILFDMGDLGGALQRSEKALELSIKNGEKRYEGLSKIWIGRILGSKKEARYEEGEPIILEGCGILKELCLRPAMAQGHLNLGVLYKNSGAKIRAVEEFGKAKSMFEEMKMDYWTAKCQKSEEGL